MLTGGGKGARLHALFGPLRCMEGGIYLGSRYWLGRASFSRVRSRYPPSSVFRLTKLNVSKHTTSRTQTLNRHARTHTSVLPSCQ
jgi:hypothetical protein